MEFRHPVFFLLLIFLPVIFIYSKMRKPSAIRFSDVGFLKKRPVSWRMTAYQLLPLLRLLVYVFLVTALARPQKISGEREYTTKGVDIVVALDISGSMLAEDFKPANRIEVAKKQIINFIHHRDNDRIGLVVFARKAYTQCPLTSDYDVLTHLAEEIQIGMISDGTAIGLGLATAINRLRDSDAKSKVIILASDGSNNAGNIDPITAAELAKTFGFKVYTILIGKGGLVPFPINDPLFGKRYVQAEVDIDPLTMKRIADITGGKYFWAHSSEELATIYEEIDQLEKSEIKVKEYRNFEELFPYFLIPGLILLLVELVLKNTIAVKIP